MNLRFVEAFLWVARLKSFKGAAERLHTTQAAISSRIATLEEELGVRLFERDSRSVTLTLRGTAILPLAEQLLATAARMRSAVGEAAEFTGTLRIGVMETVVHTVLPTLLQRFAAAYPRVTVEIHSDITPFLREELLRGTLDCVLASEVIGEGSVESQRIAALPMAWVAAPTLLPGAQRLAFADIAAHPLITFHKRSVIYRDMLAVIGDPARLRINFSSSLAAMISLAENGFGIATLPHAVIERELAEGSLVALPVDPPLAPLPIVASVPAGGASDVTETFARLAAEACAPFNTPASARAA